MWVSLNLGKLEKIWLSWCHGPMSRDQVLCGDKVIGSILPSRVADCPAAQTRSCTPLWLLLAHPTLALYIVC